MKTIVVPSISQGLCMKATHCAAEGSVPMFGKQEDGAPEPAPREELADFISQQEGRIGDVFNLTQEGLDARAIADRLNVETQGFVYQYQAHIDAALYGKVPTGPTMLKAVASALNGLLKRGRGVLSPAAFELLAAHRASVLNAIVALDPEDEAQAEAQAEDNEQKELGALLEVPGIYAFSYGWYLERPLDAQSENTLIKVGRAKDVARRIEDHRRGARAHIPEPLVTIRAYATDDRDLEWVEKTFQRLLETAGHINPRREPTRKGSRNEVGEEWYLTNREFLDAIASALSLRTIYAA
ncbi:GIY-YIG nuclease family protein [Rhodococcoides fascians]|uniref:GIY-YIG nuclease family protein n=1 Tax=Rhodococcoides fascians TaxID=1828 RepID=UPI0015C5EA28|nr:MULTISPECIES: GIY-YIG nuclease family protein [Rhodococcus]